MTADRARLESELEQLVAALLDRRGPEVHAVAVADELRRRIRWLVGNRAEILVPVPGSFIPTTPAAGPVIHTVTVGTDDIAALRHALTSIVGDAEKLRRIAYSSTREAAAAAARIPSVADRLPDVWLEVLR